MSLAFDPQTGEVTTTFRLEQEKLERARQNELDKITASLISDAISWRCLPKKLQESLLKYGKRKVAAK